MWLGSGNANPTPFSGTPGIMQDLRDFHTHQRSLAPDYLRDVPNPRDPLSLVADVSPPPFSARLIVLNTHDQPTISFPMTFHAFHWEYLRDPDYRHSSWTRTQMGVSSSLLPLDDPQGSPWEPDGYIRQCGRPSRHGFHAFPPQPGAPLRGRPSNVLSLPIPSTQLAAIESTFRAGPHRVALEFGSPYSTPVAIIAGDTLSPGPRQYAATRLLATPISTSGRVYTLQNPHDGHRPRPPSLPAVVASTDFSRRGYTPRGPPSHIVTGVPFHHLAIDDPSTSWAIHMQRHHTIFPGIRIHVTHSPNGTPLQHCRPGQVVSRQEGRHYDSYTVAYGDGEVTAGDLYFSYHGPSSDRGPVDRRETQNPLRDRLHTPRRIARPGDAHFLRQLESGTATMYQSDQDLLDAGRFLRRVELVIQARPQAHSPRFPWVRPEFAEQRRDPDTWARLWRIIGDHAPPFVLGSSFLRWVAEDGGYAGQEAHCTRTSTLVQHSNVHTVFSPEGSTLASGGDGAYWLRSEVRRMCQELANVCAGLVIHSSRDSLTPLARMFELCNHFSKWPCCSGIQYGCHERPVYPICPMPHSGPQSGFSIRISHLNDANVVTGSILIECEDSDTRLYSPDCWSGPEGYVLDDVERHLHRSATLFPTNAYEPHGFHHDGLPVIRDMATSNLPHATLRVGLARAIPASTFGIPISQAVVEQVTSMMHATRSTGTRVLLQVNDPTCRDVLYTVLAGDRLDPPRVDSDGFRVPHTTPQGPHHTISDPTHPLRIASTFRARHAYPSHPWSRTIGHAIGGDLFITFPRDGLGSAWTTSRDPRARSITAQSPLISSSMWEDMSNSQPSWATVHIRPGPDPSIPGLPNNQSRRAEILIQRRQDPNNPGTAQS